MSDTSLRFDVPGHRLICAMCIEWFDFSELYVDEDGITWDFCKPCAHEHAVAMILLLMAGRPIVVTGESDAR